MKAAQNSLVKVSGVRISAALPCQTVNFKPRRNGHSFRVTSRGLPKMFVTVTDKGAEARIVGQNPIEARSADKVFAKAASVFWATGAGKTVKVKRAVAKKSKAKAGGKKAGAKDWI